MTITRRGVTAAGLVGVCAGAMLGAQTSRAAPGGHVLDVLVLGAGVSGLNTAWMLEQQGLKVTVLEARQRVGGRVHTLFDQPGYPEMGFNSMGAGYGRGIDAAKRAGVELVDVAPRFIKSYHQELVLGGKLLTRDQWAASPDNPFPVGRKALMPWELSGRVIAETNPLKDWAAWADPKNAALDVSLHDFLASQGLNDASIKLAVDTAPYYGASSRDVSALLYEFNDGWGKTQSGAGRQSWAVKGGNQQLPMAMAKLLKGDVLLGKQVVGVSSEADGATVLCADGSRFRAKRVVCALPFATLRKIKLDPALTGPQAEAVRSLRYQPITLAFLTVKAPFWRQDGLSPSMWTDGPLGAAVAQRFGATDDDVTGILVFARGELARAWDRLPKAEILKRVVAEYEAIRPASRGQLSGAAVHSWALEPFNGGDWAYFAPGQIMAFAQAMALPAGRLHFCGEHTATANRGLEGALESSERVAVEVLSA